MRTYFKTLKAILAVALCFSLAMPMEAVRKNSTKAKTTTVSKKMNKNSFQTPDFAYPKTVAKNAQAEYDQAIANGDCLNALRAAIQLNIAETSVDAEGDVNKSLNRYGELGDRLSAPWNAVATLLQADLYTQIYNSNSWNFDQRKLPLGSYPGNVQEWSGDMFAMKSMGCVRKAMERAAGSASASIREIAGLLENAAGAETAGMTVLDFIRMKGADIISSYCPGNSGEQLRFGNVAQELTPREQCAEMRKAIYQEGMKENMANGNTAMASMFAYRSYRIIANPVAKRKFLDECYRQFGDTEWGADFVYEYAQDLQSRPGADGQSRTPEETNALRRQALEILTRFNDRYPNAPASNSILYAISTLKGQSVNINLPEKFLPDTEVKCSLNATNLYDFKLLLYKLPDELNDYVQLKDIRAKGKLVRSVPVKLVGSTPDCVSDSLTLQGLAPGNYVLLPSTDGTLDGVVRDRKDSYFGTSLFQVTDLAYFINKDEKGRRLFIVDAHNQQPLPGVKVHLKEDTYRGKAQTWDVVTEKDGGVALPGKNLIFRAVRGASYVTNNAYGWYRGHGNDEPEYIGQVLTDLSIYKPGQELGFVGILGMRKGHDCSELKRQEVLFRLFDANNQQVDSLSAKTDDKGRASGQFTIPKDGLLGLYRLGMQIKDAKGQPIWLSGAWVEVADYKSPTFKVLTEKIADRFALGDTLNIVGKAVTYSGMPVSGAKVDYTVKYTPWRFWWGGYDGSAEFNGTTQTAADGGFNIVLPTETIRDTPFEKGAFTLSIKVTDQAGETRQSEPVRFSFMSAYSLGGSFKDMICVDDKNADTSVGSVKVTDMLGYPVDRTIYYAVKDAQGDQVLKGEQKPGEFKIDTAKLPSGKYSIYFALNPEMKPTDGVDPLKAIITLWRTTDKKPAVKTPLWAPVKEVTALPGQKTVEIPVGSSYDESYIYCCKENGEKTLSAEWLKVSDGIIKVKVDAPDAKERIYVHLIGMHDMESRTVKVTVVPEVQTEKVEISTESFRDRMAPGDEEVWKFRFTIGGRPMVQRPVMAVMSNQALNAIRPFRWNMSLDNGIYWGSIVNIGNERIGMRNLSFQYYPSVKDKHAQMFSVPEINTYNRSLYAGGYGRGVMYDLMSNATGGVMLAEAVVDEAKDEAPAPRTERKMAQNMRIRGTAKKESADEAPMEAEADAGGAGEQQQEELRPVEMPLAFFMPDLLTDGDGVATVNFLVPNFNGTWQFQIAGYTPDLKGEVKVQDVVAAKQVMVQMNAPRFLRTGDKAQISATLFNNSTGKLPVGGKIEILDADGNVLQSQEFASEELNASGQRTVTVGYDVPANLSEVHIRAYAIGGRHRDGEGVTIAVLPSSTPVIESKTFYAGPGMQTIKVDMPKNIKDATVTLQYCGNPVWECVTALPSIMTPESTNILAQVNALYGNAIARGLIKDYPRLADALRTFSAPENAGDSTMVSNLEKNRQLKAVTLNNTPWVNNAKDETRRMQSLVEYLDTAKSEAAIKAIMKTLKERQNNDGGWSWCPDMPTSEFITGRVQLHLAMLKGMGYLPDGAEEMVLKSFDYSDREMVKDWEQSQRKYFSVIGMMNYLYVKSFFPSAKDAKVFVPLRNRALKAIEKDWKTFDIYSKATAVTLEYRLRNTKLAADILESLRQYAKVTPEKGMCFENLKGAFSGWNPLITTAQVLEAYGEAAPKDAAVDQLRQWLLMSKQTQDWGAMNGTAEVVQAILSTGSDWTEASKVAKVMVAGQELQVPARAAITDSFTLTLTPEQVKRGGITIDKSSAGPAWGGVVSQYVAPILDVKSEGVPQLKIEKNVYSIDGGKAVAGNLKVGDRVRVTISITTDRDMDYVAVIDSRSACLEPADQLSGYAASDGVWMYREVRDTQTNLFIPFLPKGTSVISYECFVDRAGEYTLGIAQAQSQYAPVISAHSAGVKLTVK